MAKIHSGFIVIADITGYTSYLSQSELEHAQEILQSLLELLIGHTKPPMVISRLAGDAVISYAIESRPVQGQAFVEMIEDTYVSFRKAINQMVLNTTCDCDACANINGLDLKFFVHHGTFSIQKLDAHEELVGHEVNTIFRMTKNDVSERTGMKAYTLFSDAAIQELKLPGFSDGLVAHNGEYDDVGRLEGWVLDMHPVWESKRDSMRVTVAADDVLYRHEMEFPVPPEIMWDYLSRPEFRAVLTQANRQVVHNRQDGRVGSGTVFECFHGNGKPTTQTVLEWHPFKLIVTQDTTPIPGLMTVSQTELSATAGGGTLVAQSYSKGRASLVKRLFGNVAARALLPRAIAKGMTALSDQIQEDLKNEVITVPESVLVRSEAISTAVAESLSTGGDTS